MGAYFIGKRVVDAVGNIATKLGATVTTNTGNKLADNLEAIVAVAGSGSGGGSGVGVLLVTETEGALNKTWQEIYDAMENGVVVISGTDKRAVATDCEADNGAYTVTAGATFTAETASGYPSTESSPK